MIFGGLNLLGIIKGYIASLIYVKMSNKMGFGFIRAVLQHIQRASLSYSNNKDLAYISNRVATDTSSMIGFCITVLQGVTTNIIKLVAPFLVLFLLNRFITLLMLLFLMVYLLLYFACKKLLYEVGFKLRETQARFFSGMLEQLKFIKLIKVNAIQNEFNQRVDKKFSDHDRAAQRNQKVNYLYSGMDGIISTTAQIILFVIGGLQILNGNFTIGMFTIFTAYFNMMLGAARYFYGLGAAFQQGKASCDRMEEIFAQKPEIYGKEFPGKMQNITFRNVSFAYHKEEVIRNFDTSLTIGNMYAIIGANGAGKSTLVNLMLGLYVDEYSGEIIYNHTNIRNIDMNAVRKNHIGYAAQEPELITDTIIYNLTHGKPYDSEHLDKCIKILNMSEFIAKHSLDYVINDTNNNISGGEKQKIAILAALSKNPCVMIFDEPTSALDADSAKRFVNYLRSIKDEKIIVIITHDPQVQSHCDEIIKL